MTVNEFINLLHKHNVDFDKDLAVAIGENDGSDFHVEESEYTIFLVQSDWGEIVAHEFLDEKEG